MISIDVKMSQIYEYLSEVIKLSPEELRAIKTAIGAIHEMTPADGPGVMSKTQNMIAISEDLSWVISSITRMHHKINKEIKKIKDPEFVMLVRQGRPSTQAIESEIRFNNDNLVNLEEDIEIIENILDYLKHVETGIERYIWLLRDKGRFIQ